MNLNKAIIVGNLTRDPESKKLPTGNTVTNFSIATNENWVDKQGVKKSKTEYHNIVVYGRIAETSAQFLKSGQSVLVEGKLQTRDWEQDNGKKAYRTEIVASSVQFGRKAAEATQQVSRQETAIEYPIEDINPEDIPF